MNISARCEYACRAMLELAATANQQQPINSVAIAARRGIPEKYLAHILLQLKRAGLVRSVRGARGGYALEMPARDISLLDIVEAIDGPILTPLPVRDGASQELQAAWGRVAEGIENTLREMSLDKIAESASDSAMYYI